MIFIFFIFIMNDSTYFAKEYSIAANEYSAILWNPLQHYKL